MKKETPIQVLDWAVRMIENFFFQKYIAVALVRSQ